MLGTWWQDRKSNDYLRKRTWQAIVVDVVRPDGGGPVAKGDIGVVCTSSGKKRPHTKWWETLRGRAWRLLRVYCTAAGSSGGEKTLVN